MQLLYQLCACICFIYDCFLLEAPLTFIDISKRKYFLQARPSESSMLYENKPRTVRLSSILLKEGNEPTPVL